MLEPFTTRAEHPPPGKGIIPASTNCSIPLRLRFVLLFQFIFQAVSVFIFPPQATKRERSRTMSCDTMKDWFASKCRDVNKALQSFEKESLNDKFAAMVVTPDKTQQFTIPGTQPGADPGVGAVGFPQTPCQKYYNLVGFFSQVRVEIWAFKVRAPGPHFVARREDFRLCRHRAWEGKSHLLEILSRQVRSNTGNSLSEELIQWQL